MSLRTTAAAAAALLLAAGTLPAGAVDFTDAAARRVALPDHITRVMPAGPSADALMAMVAPDRLIGWSVPHAKGLLPARLARLRVVGTLTGNPPTVGPEAVMRLRPDLVIDAGPVTPERAVFADQMQQQTGVPYVLVDSSIVRIPATLRVFGALFGDADRGQDLSRYARHALETLHGRLLIRPTGERPRVYLARGADGLETGLPGSPAGEAIDEAGAINVATPLGRGERVRITRQQLLDWDPTIIICTDRRFYGALHRDSSLRRLAAVRQKRVYLMPADPFGWIDEPPGVNRAIGLYWLSDLLYPGMGDIDLRTTIRDLYAKLYAVKLTNGQLERLVRDAGFPKNETLPMPLAGLGAAPGTPLPMPGVTPGIGAPARRGPAISPSYPGSVLR